MRDEVTHLAALLDAVHAALRGGNYAALSALTEAVAALTPDTWPRDAGAMRLLRRKLERNEACLQASARGLRAARRRIADITAARSGLQTYSEGGQRQRIGGSGPTLSQRY